MDGTARGGIVIALAEKFKLPIHAVGVGEKAEDLRDFSAEEFAKGLVGDTVQLSTTEVNVDNWAIILIIAIINGFIGISLMAL